MFVIESCQKIEYNALFMMPFIPVSNFGDQPLAFIFHGVACKKAMGSHQSKHKNKSAKICPHYPQLDPIY